MTTPLDERGFSVMPSQDLLADIAFYTQELDLKLLSIYPSGNARYAELSGMGLSLLLDTDYRGEPGRLLIKTELAAHKPVVSPSGTEIVWQQIRPEHAQSLDSHCAEICTLRGSPWATGSAGTHIRDLIPSRLGGGLIASHIRIPNGGPVADRVHYHTTEFQLVICIQGWISLAYEDQGDPIILKPGDCVLQPPHIRHKVLETSNGLEVIEISTPSEHVSAIDNDLHLPMSRVNTHRLFHGQRFCHFQQSGAQWKPHRVPGFAAADTGVMQASVGVAGASLLKASGTVRTYSTQHSANALFSYVLAGSIRINKQLLVAGDAFTLPPGVAYTVGDISTDLAMLELSLPGAFDSTF